MESVEVFDGRGERVYNYKNNILNGQHSLTLEGQNGGLFVVRVNGEFYHKIFVVK